MRSFHAHELYFQLDSIRSKQIARWLYLSGMDMTLFAFQKMFWLVQYAAGYLPGIIRDQWRHLELIKPRLIPVTRSGQ